MRKFALLLSCLLLFAWHVVFAQSRTITGKVTDADNGSPLPGVSVVVKGTSIGTVTNVDGNFSLTIPADAKSLVFSFVGMIPREVPLTSANTYTVGLTPEVIGVDEVVVTGYGIQRKRELTGSIAQIKGEAIANLATPSFEGQLSGRLPGVQITTTTGVLGQAPTINIRGVNSITSGTYPLIVVDGVPILTGNYGAYAATPHNTLADINPSDIASVEV
jgi:hypothetical protein